MMELIKVNPDKCVGCNACVRVCPAPEANITKQLEDGRFVTTVDSSKCIACGECVKNCMHGARDYNDDTEEVMENIRTEQHIVIAAPAIKTVFPDKWKSILNWFKRNNCLVYDVSFGADICTWAHLRTIQNGVGNKLISQPCAAIVKYIETYQPVLLNNLAPIHSPMLCAVTYIKKYLRKRHKIIALSPCVAKKNEFTETGLVDYNVTFKKLLEYFMNNNINIERDSSSDFKYDFELFQGQVGGVYPRPGGLRDNLWLHDPDINITTSEGVHKVYPELDMYAKLSENLKPEVFDVLSCDFGCNVGAGTGTTQTIFEIMATMRDVEKEAKSRRKTSGGFFRGAEDKLFKKFDEELSVDDFVRTYIHTKPAKAVTSAELEPIFKSMGKDTTEKKNYDCHACGYRSCREMAVAIYRGLNVPENCIVHAKARMAEDNKIIQQRHDFLSQVTSNCLEISNKLKSEADRISDNIKNVDGISKTNEDFVSQLNDLISALITVCESSEDGISQGDVGQIIEILKSIKDVFSKFSKNIDMTNSNNEEVSTNVTEINTLIISINDELSKVNK